MISSNPIHQVCNYGSSASYCSCPTPEQIATGVIPLDSLPAAWWNWMWNDTNKAVNEARGAMGVVISEIDTVLQQAGVCPSDVCTDQLYQSINKIRQTVGDASVAGAVKSSSAASEVAIDANGIMTVNCLGNAASLTTSARTVVGAINELKSTYDCCFTDTATAIGGKAPTSHASSATTYGVGTASDYGHLKISDTYTSLVGCACDGVAASQKAVNDLYGMIGQADYNTAYWYHTGCPTNNCHFLVSSANTGGSGRSIDTETYILTRYNCWCCNSCAGWHRHQCLCMHATCTSFILQESGYDDTYCDYRCCVACYHGDGSMALQRGLNSAASDRCSALDVYRRFQLVGDGGQLCVCCCYICKNTILHCITNDRLYGGPATDTVAERDANKEDFFTGGVIVSTCKQSSTTTGCYGQALCIRNCTDYPITVYCYSSTGCIRNCVADTGCVIDPGCTSLVGYMYTHSSASTLRYCVFGPYATCQRIFCDVNGVSTVTRICSCTTGRTFSTCQPACGTYYDWVTGGDIHRRANPE